MAGYEKALNKNNFNFLRLAGACLVIFSHCYDIIGKSGSEPIENFLQSKLAASGIGLCIFFFISGYFVSKSAVETKGVFYFLKKRIYRIYPALIIIVLLTVFVLGPIFSTLKISAYFLQPDTWKYLYTISGIRIRAILPGVFTGEHFFSNGVNASIWTISWEIILYIFLALLISIRLLKKKRTISILSLFLAICCFAIAAFFPIEPFYHKYINLTGIFFLGSFTYCSSLSRKKILTLFCTALVIFIVSQILKVQFFRTEVALFIAICMGTYLFGFSKKIKIWLANDISYGLYIIAFPFQQIIFQLTSFNRSIPLQLAFTFLVCIPIAYLSWKFIEQPFIQKGHNYKIIR
jgi:peptidoglycan/LPS O-acetylase OafA/YrhL